tara:strand:+ start:7241 stop:8338 length:1098 start_codon:yes stop_codon:yes gene_type:complete
MQFKFFLISLYFILFPFYFLPKGSIQIADIFGIILILISLNDIIFNILKSHIFKILLIFIIYSFVVNLVWSLVLENPILLKNSLNYLYCYLLVIALSSLFNNSKNLRFLYNVILFSVLIQLSLFFLNQGSNGLRIALFFNNPNQLALWSVNLLVIFNVISHKLKFNYLKKIFLSIIATFFGLISLSKTVLVVFIFYWFYIFMNKKFIISKTLFILFLGLIIYNYSSHFENFKLIQNVIVRLESDNTADDTLEGRGFDRIINHKEYLIFGAGEGLYDRFNSKYNGEIHSSFFNILFSYGIISSFLFFLFLIQLIKGKTKYSSLKYILLICLFVFSLGHFTLRIPYYWFALISINFLNINFNKKNLS